MSFLDQKHATLPAAVREAASCLDRAGHDAWLVGEGLTRLLRGDAPAAFELCTPASVDDCLDLFPHAVPTHPDRGVVTVPAGPAPIDVTGLRWGPKIEDDLAHRDFTVLAMAYAPVREEWIDPSSGLADLEAGVLRGVGDPLARMHEDPVRVLRAARLVAEWDLVCDPSVEQAMTQVAPSLVSVSSTRLRAELCRILLADGAERGLSLLRKTGVERRLVRDVRPDAAALVGAMPAVLELRLAAWLRGAAARALLKRLRFGLVRSQHVARLLEHHPLDTKLNANRDRSVLRAHRQLSETDLAALFRMREWEIAQAGDDPEARKRLEAVRNGLERVRQNTARSEARTVLCLDGSAVMALLDCPPGRQVGAALRFAAEWVAADPARNEPDRLREAILAWSRR